MKNKPIILIAAVIILLGVGVSIYSLLFKSSPADTVQSPQKQNQSPADTQVQMPFIYYMSVNYLSQNISGQVTINGNVLSLDQTGLNQYGLVSLNNSNDILWLKCAIGYSLSSPTSASGNKVTTVGESVNIEIMPTGQNNLAVTCLKD